MNGIRTTGVGVALALAAAPGLAQQSAPAPSPAATLGRVAAVDAAPTGPVVRAAAPDNRPTALFPSPAFRTQTGQPPTGGSNPLAPPKPVDGQPNVTESRTPPGGGTPLPPGVGMPQPTPFVPGGAYPPHVVPGGYPAPGYPGPGYPAPSYPVPGYPAPQSGGGMYAPAPAPAFTFPAGPSATYAPAVTGPVIGGTMTACDPYAGAGGMVTPVSPSAPGVGGGYEGGLYTSPQPQSPYWANNGWDPLFPRARNVAGAVLSPFTQKRLVLSGEYLLWFARSQQLPPLLTTSSPAFNGILGQGDTRVIYGDGTEATSTRHSGARFSAAYWFNDLWALDGNVWFLGKNTGGFSADTSQFPLLARPFVNANTGANFSQLIASPGLATGAAVINNETSLWGNEINLRRALLCYQCARVDALLGFRNLNLSEEINITESFARTPNSNTGIGVPTVTSGVVQDRFRTENHFYGVNLGLSGELRRGWWFLAGRAGVGLGTVQQEATIAGFQQLNTSTGAISAQGGLLALPGANIGTFRQSKFGVLPDAGLTLGVYVTPNVRLGVGYNLMYLNSVVRPADQIDQVIDVRRIPNFPVGTVPAIAGVRPSAFPLKTTDFFVQGINFSLMWTF